MDPAVSIYLLYLTYITSLHSNVKAYNEDTFRLAEENMKLKLKVSQVRA